MLRVRLMATRATLNAAAPEGVKVSVNDMVVKAAAKALIAARRTPRTGRRILPTGRRIS